MNAGIVSAIAKYNNAHPELTLAINIASKERVILEINGRLDLETSTHIKPIIDSIILAILPGGFLTLDLHHVNYISSTGVGLLSTILVQTIKQSKHFSLARIQAPVRKVIEILGFSNFMNIESQDD